MDILNLKRCSGKTTHCIQRSYCTGYTIICMNCSHKKQVVSMAERMGLDIPEPYVLDSVQSLEDLKTLRFKGIIVDEMPFVLQVLIGMPIDLATMTIQEVK